MKVLTVIGARPQFVKAAVVSREIRKNIHLSEVLVHTGQHHDANMSDVFFEEMGIPKPDYYLGIDGGIHGEQTGKMMIEIEKVILEEKPDKVLVYGDTNSTLAAALVASKLHIPVMHVEAGLRSFNKQMPEEVNRIVTDHVSDMLFVPTTVARRHLLNEGISESKIKFVGDVMYDAAIYYKAKAEKKSSIIESLLLVPKDFILTTIHRPANTDSKENLVDIINQLEELAQEHTVVLPIHPRTRKQMEKFNIQIKSIQMIDPVGYLDMVTLEANSKLIITDSGGVQKEAYFHEIPCVTLRNETEWTELLEGGHNVLVNNFATLKALVEEQLNKTLDFSEKIYGNANSAVAISKNLQTVC